jgi:adenine-specific DNA methylase
MSNPTKPSFLEGGLPCASLSAECQRDNNARQRPPQNRLHIWWARRPPTICRAAILGGLLPHDLDVDPDVLPEEIPEPTEEEILEVPPKLKDNIPFYRKILEETNPTELSKSHGDFLRLLGITGDAAAAYRRMAKRDQLSGNEGKIHLPDALVYRHPPAISISPKPEQTHFIRLISQKFLEIPEEEPINVLDFMAGGGVIPLEAVRYGMKVYANDLNPVASLVLKATIQYPTQFGKSIQNDFFRYAEGIDKSVENRLKTFFSTETESEWWESLPPQELKKLKSQKVEKLEPAGEAKTLDYLWCRLVPCPNCGLNIPISTNFHIVSKKGKPEAALAAFPEVPSITQGNDCTFRIVPQAEWKHCQWPKPDFRKWHPRDTPTFKNGDALCPRCGNVVEGDEVKAFAKSRPGGLPAQMYAIASKVPVKLTYQNGDEKIRYLWRFRSPSPADLEAVERAEAELARQLPDWEADGLVPDERIPIGEKTREPLNVGINFWRDLFLPRQLLTNLVVLEEIRKAQKGARETLSPDEAEAVSVYLAFILSKVINYNSVNTFWHYGRQTVTQTFSRHDFAFRPAFCEFEGARETVMWGASQIMGAYAELVDLIHGRPAKPQNAPASDEEDTEDDDTSPDEDEELADSVDDDSDSSEIGTADPAAEPEDPPIRPDVIPPTVTCEDAAALRVPEPGTVHLICVDPPYYSNVQYAELSNFFYVWLKRALGDVPGLAHLFQEPLAETNREAVANKARWQAEAEAEIGAWQRRYDEAFEAARAEKAKVAEAKKRALETAGPKPPTAAERAGRFYEGKMSQVFRRARQLLHPAGRMVVMFNHKQTWAWRSLGMALIHAGFDIRSSVPIHTEAESSLNIRGLDAARSTVLLLCVPREEAEQPVGNWAGVQTAVTAIARGAAERFQEQGLAGTDLYLSSLGPAIGEVARNWPVTDFSGDEVDLEAALEAAYRSVAQWRLEQLLAGISAAANLGGVSSDFNAASADRDTQTLWLWLDTFQGEIASSDDVQKMAKSLNVDPKDLKAMGLLAQNKDLYRLRPPAEIDLRALSRRLAGEPAERGRKRREADVWEERAFPGFLGAAVWNAIGLMAGDGGAGGGPPALRQWLRNTEYGTRKDFFATFAVTLHLLENVFAARKEDDSWRETARQARRAWDLVLKPEFG